MQDYNDSLHRGRRIFHGRIIGRGFSQRKRDLLETALPKIAISLPKSDTSFVRIETIFPKNYRYYHLEIGFGGGEHLIWQSVT